MSVRDPRDVLLAPVISEKSYGLIDAGQYTFIVLPEANKTQIKIAVEQIFNVKVLAVNTINRQGKRKRSRARRWASARTPSAPSSRSPPASASRSSGARAPDGSPIHDRTRETDRDLRNHGHP